MNCKNCNAVMKADQEKKVFICPYCESTEPFNDFSNEELKKELKGIVSEAIRDANQTNDGAGGSKEGVNKKAGSGGAGPDSRSTGRKVFDGIIIVVQVFFCMILAALSLVIFTDEYRLAGIVSLAQLVLLIAAIAMKINYFTTGSKKRKKTATICAVAASILILAWFGAAFIGETFGTGGSIGGKTSWPKQGLGSQIPQMPGKLDYTTSYNGEFSATAKKVSADDFANYVEQCKAAGFTIGVTETGEDFMALDENDNLLEIEYRDYSNSIVVDMMTLDFQPFKWNDQGVAGQVPKPTAEKIYTVSFSNERYEVYVGDVTRDQFEKYAADCIAEGFGGSWSNNRYSGQKGETHISVDFECGKLMHIRIYSY